jgi:outer membrane protein assembly factor BamD (BamD/ComL family)
MDQVQSLVFQALEKIETTEREDYSIALRKGTVEAIRAFIDTHPGSPYVEDAREKIRLLLRYDEELRRRDQAMKAAFDQALASKTPEAMESFLERYPDASQAAEGRRLKDVWSREKEQDQQAFEEALAEKTTSSLERFLAERPDSPNAPRARAELDRLQAAEKAFDIAAESRSIPAIEVFLATHAGTPLEAEARQLLETLRQEEENRAREVAKKEAEEARLQQEEARRKAEAEEGARVEAERAAREAAERRWDEAEQADTPEAYEAFLSRYPEHPRAEEARRRAAALRLSERESPTATPPVPESQPREELLRDWSAARQEDSREAYEAFLSRHPEGEQADLARSRLQELESPADPSPQKLPRAKRRALQRYREMLRGK